jgi:SAM-dependent methyltransferase
VSIWASGPAYESYVGRWSRLVAREFLAWLEVAPNGRWLDVGCGTGALTATILALASPSEATGVDSSEGYVAHARERIADARARLQVADARHLPFETSSFDTVVSGLVLNFLPTPLDGLLEMARVARPGGTVAAYVWDYADQMQLMRSFWDAAAALDPPAVELDEGRRFPLCRPEPLQQLLVQAGLADVSVRAVDVPTVFQDFDDYWAPFLGGQGPAPSYAATLDDERRAALRERIRQRLPMASDGTIRLIARAWAARGRKPSESHAVS